MKEKTGQTPAEIECYADHRIAMSFAVLGCAVEGVTILDPVCTAKTYPKFFEVRFFPLFSVIFNRKCRNCPFFVHFNKK